MKNSTDFPPGCNEERVRRVLQHYDSLTEDEEVAEDEKCARPVLDAKRAA